MDSWTRSNALDYGVLIETSRDSSVFDVSANPNRGDRWFILLGVDLTALMTGNTDWANAFVTVRGQPLFRIFWAASQAGEGFTASWRGELIMDELDVIRCLAGSVHTTFGVTLGCTAWGVYLPK